MSNNQRSKIKMQKSKRKDLHSAKASRGRRKVIGNKREEKSNIKVYFFSLASTGEGISGGDRIYIELARRWSKKTSVNIVSTIEGVNMMARQKLKGKKLNIISLSNNLPDRFIIKFLYKTLVGIKIGMTLDFKEEKVDSYLYSSSEFWMDVLPTVLLKIRYPKKVKWIATWYQTAPNPITGYKEKGERNNSYTTNAMLYWLVQLPVKPLIKLYADKVIVNNEEERKQFPKMDKREEVIVLIGAAPLADIKKFQQDIEHRTKDKEKKYDAVFQGRFHAQKGVVELIDIWRKVVEEIPDAKLAMIGDGPLKRDVELRVKSLGLGKNVKLFGYVFDGPKKYDVFANSKLVVHPAYYDSGGMASAEAMAFGIPVVAFDLKAYESYYPKGMIRAENEADFAKQIIKLLRNEKKRKKLGNEAKTLIETNYSWDNRAKELYSQIT